MRVRGFLAQCFSPLSGLPSLEHTHREWSFRSIEMKTRANINPAEHQRRTPKFLIVAAAEATTAVCVCTPVWCVYVVCVCVCVCVCVQATTAVCVCKPVWCEFVVGVGGFGGRLTSECVCVSLVWSF